MTLVVVEPVERSGPKGDRDPHRHPYRDYRIHVLQDDEQPSSKTVVETINGFDLFWTTIRPQKEIEAQAYTYARQLSRRLRTGSVITLKKASKS